MTVLHLSFNGDPRGKGRPRTAVRGRHATIYTDAKTRSYEASIKAIAKAYMASRNDGGRPLEGPLSVSIRFRLAIPKSTPKWLTKKYLSGEEAYLGQFDLDNMTKALNDGLNGVCWIDDKQITRSFQEKIAAEVPGLDVRIEALTPQPQP